MAARGREVLIASALIAASGLWLTGCGGEVADAAPVALDLPSNRAYSGAPPVIPHAVQELGRQDCLSCHLRGDAAGDERPAKRTPHPELERCVQCHVERKSDGLYRRSTFVGHTYLIGHRQQPQGPWLVPHPLTLRENCVGCHGAATAQARLRTKHPERVRCTQCHVPAHEGFPGPRPGWSL